MNSETLEYFWHCLDPSDPPEKPEIVDYDKDYVEISWRPPKNDGGAPIEKYIVEKKEKGSDKWEKVRPYHNFSALTLVCSLRNILIIYHQKHLFLSC